MFDFAVNANQPNIYSHSKHRFYWLKGVYRLDKINTFLVIKKTQPSVLRS